MKKAVWIFLIFCLIYPASGFSQIQWDSIETENFVIFYPPKEKAPALRLSKKAEGVRKLVIEALGADFKHKTRVYMAPDMETYQAVQPRSHVPEWSVGATFKQDNLVVIYTPAGAAKQGFDYNMVQVFHHEMCHIAIGMILRNRQVPRWLEEGFAQNQAMEWSTGDSFRLAIAYFMGSLIPLDELFNKWPREKDRARLAYLQSKSLVGYLSTRGYLPGIIHEMREGQNARRAIVAATYMNIPTLEKRWLSDLADNQSWFFFLFHRNTLWGWMALLFLFVYWRVRVRSKKKYKLMELEEALENQYVDSDKDNRTFH